MIPPTCFLNLQIVGNSCVMVDVAMYTIKHMKRLCISHVSIKVKSDFFRVVVDYSKAKGNLIAFFIEPITARLLELIDDEEFDQANFMTYHLSMPISVPQQSSSSSKVIEQDTLLTCNLSELSKNVRSRQLQRVNVGDPKNTIPQQTSSDDKGVHPELGAAVINSSKIAPVNLEMSFAAEEESKENLIVPVAPGPVTNVFTSPKRITGLQAQFCTTSSASSILLMMHGPREILPSIIGN
jgi:hypothetical protein